MEGKSDSDYGKWKHIEFNELELGDRIGGGGVGVIYRGYFGNTQVALKTLFDTRVDENLKQEYLDELLVMSKLSHSNIVQFMGACMTPPNLCMVLELCSGSLYSLLHEKREAFDARAAIEMAIGIGSAVEYLHAQQPVIIHRDIKSHNVLLASNGAMKLCDFGLVNSKITTAGTPCYMAPELLEGRTFNKSVDVYAFAVLLAEAFSREVPFYMVPVMEIRERVLKGDRPRAPSFGCPGRIISLIKRMWDEESSVRPDFLEIVDLLIEEGDAMPASKYTNELQGGADALDSLLGK